MEEYGEFGNRIKPQDLKICHIEFRSGSICKRVWIKKKMLALYAAMQSIWMDMIMQDHLILYAHNRNGLSDHAYFYAAA